jgi:hypothetical protein
MQTATHTIPTDSAPRMITALRSLGLRVAAQRDGATTTLIFLADEAAEAIAAINAETSQ